MKKKVISMLMCFALLFALTACKEGKTGDENGGVPCPIEGLEWGMTVDECLAALSLTEEDVEIERKTTEKYTEVTITANLPDKKAFGYSLKGVMLYLFEDYLGFPVGLCQATIHFDPVPTFEELKSAVKSEVQSYTVEDPENPLYASEAQTYNSPKTLADADPELADQYFPIREWYLIPSDASNVSP